MKFSKRLVYALVNNVFFAITLIVFGPYEIFITNINDFTFYFRDFWWILASVAAAYVIAATLIIAVLPWKIGRICVHLIFTFTLCSYIQAIFLNGKMQVMVGQLINWSTKTMVVNAAIWLAIIICSFLLFCLGKQYWNKIVLFIPGAVTVMQLTALVFLLITTEELHEETGYAYGGGYVSDQNMFDLSENKNVVVFLLDCFDVKVMNSILEKQPDILQDFDGFTYFPNSTSVYTRTYPSISYLLTGEMCYFDEKASDWVNEAFDKSTFMPSLYQNQIDIGVYTYDYYLGKDMKNHMDNYVFYDAPVRLEYVDTVKAMAKMILYRDMPYAIKEYFNYDVDLINYKVTGGLWMPGGVDEATVSKYKTFDDEWFYEQLERRGMSVADSTGTFRFYHLGSCHLDFSRMEDCGIRSLEIVNAYIDKMKELNIYKNSTIILVADHGFGGGCEGLEIPETLPLMLVKPSGVSEGEVQISNAPVSHTDFIPTVLSGFGLEYGEFGRTVFDISETEDRTRYCYYTAYHSNEEGEIELREYEVKGNALQHENFVFTGNRWDIMYSLNIIAR